MTDDKEFQQIFNEVYKELQTNGDKDAKNLSKETVYYHLKQIIKD